MKNNDVQLHSNERIDDLQYNGLVIVQNKDYYCFSSDAVLLANFVKAKNTDTIVDLCSGSGVVGILAQAKTNAKKVVLIEKQKELADMCKKTISINDLNEKVELHNIDVIDAPSPKLAIRLISLPVPRKKNSDPSPISAKDVTKSPITAADL